MAKPVDLKVDSRHLDSQWDILNDEYNECIDEVIEPTKDSFTNFGHRFAKAVLPTVLSAVDYFVPVAEAQDRNRNRDRNLEIQQAEDYLNRQQQSKMQNLLKVGDLKMTPNFSTRYKVGSVFSKSAWEKMYDSCFVTQPEVSEEGNSLDYMSTGFGAEAGLVFAKLSGSYQQFMLTEFKELQRSEVNDYNLSATSQCFAYLKQSKNLDDLVVITSVLNSKVEVKKAFGVDANARIRIIPLADLSGAIGTAYQKISGFNSDEPLAVAYHGVAASEILSKTLEKYLPVFSKKELEKKEEASREWNVLFENLLAKKSGSYAELEEFLQKYKECFVNLEAIKMPVKIPEVAKALYAKGWIDLSKMQNKESSEQHVFKNFSEAVDEWQYKPASMAQAMMYESGYLIREDKAKARSIFQSLANEGYLPAIVQMIMTHKYAMTLIDQQKENEWREALAKIDKSPGSVEGLEWIQYGADNGVLSAITLLAVMYQNGWGVEKNDKKAFDYFFKAANQNVSWAQYEVASMYESGRGIDENKEEAIKWYLKANDNGYSYSLRALYFLFGIDPPSETEKSDEEFPNSESRIQGDSDEDFLNNLDKAIQGDAEAQYKVGRGFHDSMGGVYPFVGYYNLVVNWYEKSSNQGFAPATRELGILYLNDIFSYSAIQISFLLKKMKRKPSNIFLKQP